MIKIFVITKSKYWFKGGKWVEKRKKPLYNLIESANKVVYGGGRVYFKSTNKRKVVIYLSNYAKSHRFEVTKVPFKDVNGEKVEAYMLYRR